MPSLKRIPVTPWTCFRVSFAGKTFQLVLTSVRQPVTHIWNLEVVIARKSHFSFQAVRTVETLVQIKTVCHGQVCKRKEIENWKKLAVGLLKIIQLQ